MGELIRRRAPRISRRVRARSRLSGWRAGFAPTWRTIRQPVVRCAAGLGAFRRLSRGIIGLSRKRRAQAWILDPRRQADPDGPAGDPLDLIPTPHAHRERESDPQYVTLVVRPPP
jgi:hypothetical protein